MRSPESLPARAEAARRKFGWLGVPEGPGRPVYVRELAKQEVSTLTPSLPPLPPNGCGNVTASWTAPITARTAAIYERHAARQCAASTRKPYSDPHKRQPAAYDRRPGTALDRAARSTSQRTDDARKVRVILPDEPPRLTPAAARALLRILVRAADPDRKGEPMTSQTKPLAFWDRVSAEDNQDPESSRAWQLTRARSLIEPHGGHIVEEFFDIDKSRSIPPQRRPEASRLLAAGQPESRL
jgi:hypothetical protein